MDRGRQTQPRDRSDSRLQLAHRAETRGAHSREAPFRNTDGGLCLVVRTPLRWRKICSPFSSQTTLRLIDWQRTPFGLLRSFDEIAMMRAVVNLPPVPNLSKPMSSHMIAGALLPFIMNISLPRRTAIVIVVLSLMARP